MLNNHHSLLEKCKSKPQYHLTLVTINAGDKEKREKREPSCTVGMNVN